ncbi:MAG TPA: MFS transporter [Polyangiaceae bacterium]|nr:MFS transporter [Polyangiaceae bacterium]
MTRSPLLPIFLIVLVDVLGLTIVFPLLSIYAETFGASAFTAALLVPAYALCQMLSGPALGSLSDRIGRRPVLLLSQCGTLIGFLMIASAQTLWLIFLGRIVDGLTAGNLTVAQAYIADNTAAKDRARSFALIGIAFGLGFLLGPAITAYLSRYSIAAPLYAAAGLSFTSIVCTATLLPKESSKASVRTESGPAGQRQSILSFTSTLQYFRRPILGGLLMEFFLYLFSFSVFLSGFALFAERRYTWQGHPFSPREIGLVFAMAGFVGIVVHGGLLGRLVRKVGEGRLTLVGLWCMAVGYALLAHVGPVIPLLVATVVSSFGNALMRPCLTSLITLIAKKEEQGVILGVTLSLSSIASILAAPLAGFLIDHAWLSAWAWTAAGFSAAALIARAFGSARVPHEIHRA